MKTIGFTKNPALANRIDSVFSSETCFGTEFREFASIFFHGMGFRVGSSSADWFRTQFREFPSFFVPWYRILNIFSPVEYFGTEFREFSVPRNSRNSAGTNQLFCLFRFPQNNFLSEIANPSAAGSPTPTVSAQLAAKSGITSHIYTCTPW
jgi:hypothetical protein